MCTAAEYNNRPAPRHRAAGRPAFEQKPDGYRALLLSGRDRVNLQSRNGSDLGPAFPEIAAVARALPPLVLDGELAVAAEGRLDFGELQRRSRYHGATARNAARTVPAHLIVFDVLDTADGPLLDQPYQARRTLLESLFADGILGPPFALCPATTDRTTASDWLAPAWGTVGIEGSPRPTSRAAAAGSRCAPGRQRRRSSAP
ncbi:ATP-dependent DNA ligase [Streptomyces pseudogriseolus]|uniref:ATP-dependent DNA ligase n=1 Tax=Streptomyces pseudogriseolus TaxID=36817 RepID=UPI003FA32BB3